MASTGWIDWLNLLVSALTLVVFVISIRFLGRQISEQQRQIAQQQLQIEKADQQVTKEHDWNRRKAVIELSLDYSSIERMHVRRRLEEYADWYDPAQDYATLTVEQRREIDESLAEYGLRPIELLAEIGLLGPRTTVIHATHVSERELELLASTGATVCACPTTEANLGDGFLPALELMQRGVPICIGTDSNTIIDPVAELREIEHCARRLVERRNVLVPPGDDGPTPYLLEIGGRNGARAIGLGDPPGEVEIDLDHPLLAGVARADVTAALIFGDAAEIDASPDGSRTSALDRARYVRNAAYGANKCRYAVTRLFEASGGSAIYDTFELQRIWRDVNAAAAHNAFMRDKLDPAFGRALLGLPASKFDRIGH